MTEDDLPEEFVALCKSITAKRPRTVIDHMLKHGQITTEELKNTYGYNHPPRAARDVKEQGIPLERISVLSSDGRRIAAYRFADPRKVRIKKSEGRTGLSKQIKELLVAKYGCRCFIYLEDMPQDSLQIDHRVPYEVAGESEAPTPDEFMLLCASANRAKSWSCEHCKNLQVFKQRETCLSCYWAFPENYTHVAMQDIRRLDLIWKGADIVQYEQLKADAEALSLSVPEFVKDMLRKALSPNA